jgi:gamma-glutamyl-gamma-aminobutyrate hydrolase PuuD
MKTINIVDVGHMFGYPVASIFKPWAPDLYEPASEREFDEVMDGTNIDLITFGGGADVDPLVYGHKNLASYTSFIRDDIEGRMFNKAVTRNIPMLGICRGSQFVCAMSGGKLIQDCDNHAIGGTHTIITEDGRVLDMTSTHHQMMYPWPTRHELIAWSPKRSARYIYGEEGFDLSFMDKEPEIVYFPSTKALGVQGHPEYFNNPNHPTVAYVRKLVATKLLNGSLI